MQRLLAPVLVIAFFFSGASALIYENLWQRQMILSFGASAPASAQRRTVGSRSRERLPPR